MSKSQDILKEVAALVDQIMGAEPDRAEEGDEQREPTTAEVLKTVRERLANKPQTGTSTSKNAHEIAGDILAQVMREVIEPAAAIPGTASQGIHPLLSAARKLFESEPETQQDYAQLFAALQAGKKTIGDEPEPILERATTAYRRGDILSPEALYAYSQLGYRPEGEKPGRTWKEVLTDTDPEDPSAQPVIQSFQEAIESFQRGEPDEQNAPAFQAFQQGRIKTPADLYLWTRRQALGVQDIPTIDEERAQQQQGQGGGILDLLQPLLAGRGGYVAQMLRASRPALQKMAPGLAGTLFGGGAAAGGGAAGAGGAAAGGAGGGAGGVIAGGALAGAAGASGGGGLAAAAGPIGLAIAGGQLVKYGLHRGVDAGVQTASPFMGQAEQEVAGGMAHSGIDALTGIGLAKEIALLPKHITEWTAALVESKEELKYFNGELAGYFTEAEARKIERQIRSGEQIGTTTATLGGTYQGLLDELQPIKDDITADLQVLLLPLAEILRLQITVSNYIRDFATPIGMLGDFARMMLGKGQEDQAGGPAFGSFIAGLAGTKFEHVRQEEEAQKKREEWGAKRRAEVQEEREINRLKLESSRLPNAFAPRVK